MKIVSWNVNGINSCMRKGLKKFMLKEKADVYCFQETKANEKTIPRELDEIGYESYHAFAKRKGYSGVSVYSKMKPLSVIKGIGARKFDEEGRVLTLEFEKFYLINAYFPNAQRGLKRIDYKVEFNKKFLLFVKKLEKRKPVIATGDFNVAHKPIDLKNPKENEKNAGFSEKEREWMDKFIESGLVDSFREFDKSPGKYTWWTYRFNARARNIGWRIDYFLVSKKLMKKVKESKILDKVMGSDHCPIELVI